MRERVRERERKRERGKRGWKEIGRERDGERKRGTNIPITWAWYKESNCWGSTVVIGRQFS